MRRYLLVMMVGAMMLATAGASVAALAQSPATPAPGTEPDVTVTVLGDVQPEGADDHLMLVQLEMPPGAATGTSDPPGTVVLYVVEGTVSYRLESGEAAVIRAGEEGEGEPIEAGTGTWIELAAGDRVIEQSGAKHAYENRGDTPAVVLLSGLYADRTGLRCASGCFGD